MWERRCDREPGLDSAPNRPQKTRTSTTSHEDLEAQRKILPFSVSLCLRGSSTPCSLSPLCRRSLEREAEHQLRDPHEPALNCDTAERCASGRECVATVQGAHKGPVE